MAGGRQSNKFWTKLHRSIKSRIAVVLIYTVLEWALIVLLLLHGLFSYFLTSFASYFALDPPCVLCSRIDHLFDPQRRRPAHRDLLCSSHLAELAECADRSSSSSEAEGKVLQRSSCGQGVDLEGTHFRNSEFQVGKLGKIESFVPRVEEEERSRGIHGSDSKSCDSSTFEGEELGCNCDTKWQEIVAAKDVCHGLEVCQEEDEHSGIGKKLEEAEENSMQVPADGLEGSSSKCGAEITSMAVKVMEDNDGHIQGHEDDGNNTNLAREKYSQLKVIIPDVTLCYGDEQSLIIPSMKCAVETRASKHADCEDLSGNEVCDEEPVNQFEEPCLKDCEDTSSIETTVENREIVTKSLGGVDLVLNDCVPERHGYSRMENENDLATPISVDGICHLDKMFMLDRREPDGNCGDEGVLTEMADDASLVDHLKSALKVAQQSLSALYAELEEERNASAIAANHTMAMITRLQEEKASMQMEALQYQRMLEEQSEYDQEALQLLNELMVKREKENQDLEKELEIYRKKVLFYEEKERQRMRNSRVTDRCFSSSELSTSDGSSEILTSLDSSEDNISGKTDQNALSLEMGKESSEHPSTQDLSLADFEKERISILDQLKKLEEKLYMIGEENVLPKHIDRIDHILAENDGLDYALSDGLNGSSNGFSNDHHCSKQNDDSQEGKKLLPFFDAVAVNDENADSREECASNFASQKMKISMEAELGTIYERLYVLEADREFLSHSLGSLKKGDKGLLLEILQHLRDLRSIELQNQEVCEAVG